jgi:hypothetical protein
LISRPPPIVNNNAIDRRKAYVATMERLGLERVLRKSA